MQNNLNLDPESETLLSQLSEQERIRSNKVAGVRTVLVILSARGMVYDRESLRQKILQTYPQATVFFRTTSNQAIGAEAPKAVDLLIDFTGPGQKQGWFAARGFRGLARVAVGRNAGLFRLKLYDRVFDEKAKSRTLARDLLERERQVQKEVLALAGIPLSLSGDALTDVSHEIALKLPPMGRL
jgi:hypothetical protein